MRSGMFVGVLVGLGVLTALVGTTGAEAQCVNAARYVAPGGNDAANACTSQGAPCATIAHAIAQACAGDDVYLASGTYVESVVADRALKFHSTGNQFNTTVRGTGAAPVVTFLASGSTWGGITIDGNGTAAAGLRVGDAAHPGVRGFGMFEATVTNARVGLLLDSTGSTGDLNQLSSVVFRNQVSNGSPDTGVGLLFVGGNGNFRMAEGSSRDNDGPGLKFAAGGTNDSIQLNGARFFNNGALAGGALRAGVEIHSASNVTVQGCDLHGQTGAAAIDDGRGLVLDGVSGATLLCNNVYGNDTGIELTGTTTGITIQHGRFTANAAAGLRLQPGSSAAVDECVFAGNPLAIENLTTTALPVTHSWWGSADGPAGPLGGSGDAVSANVSAPDFIPRNDAPVFAHKVAGIYWPPPSLSACYVYLQDALDAVPNDGLVLIAPGVYSGHFHVDGKNFSLVGPPYTSECAPVELDGTQYGTPHESTLRIANASHVTLQNLFIRSSGRGVPCDVHTPEEIGLDLFNVSNSTFRNLCTRESGTTEIKLYGDSDNNLFDNILMKGIITDSTGRHDICGHRSKQGLYIDGGPVCEGGPGAFADNNHVNNIMTRYNSRAVTVRMARNTVITNSSIHGVPCPEWDNGDFAVAVWVDMSDNTQVVDNWDIGNDGQTAAVRIQGRTAASCVTEKLDAENNVVRGNVITRSIRGVHLYRGAGDPGGPVGTQVSCNTIGAATIEGLPWPGCPTGVLDDAAIDTGKQPNLVTLNDIAGNGTGVRNTTADTFAVPRNWFGSASGPTGAGGSGDSVVGAVDPAPWLASSAMDDADGDGVTECQGDADDTNALLHPFDGCDGIDNDQDGTVDEDFVSHATTCGQGVCAASGVTQCVAGVVTDTCTPHAENSPDDASCNGLDDNCNGSVDENFTAAGTACGTGVCARTGVTTCVAGQPGNSCVPGNPTSPADTLCNGLDDDCNGLVDDAFVPGTSTCGKGVCERTGTTSCEAGVLHDSCVPGPPNALLDDDCNGIDDDCDGSIDEDYAAPATACGVGACARTGALACVNGQVTDTCTAGAPLAPVDATCNGVDDNCNGQVDEDYQSHGTTCGLGVCANTGATSCVAGHVIDSCTPISAPTSLDDSCDGLDNNCNGQVDENYLPVAITCGIGACQRTGATSCSGGQVLNNCTAGQPLSATDFTCDGVDDNCNGVADENYPVQPVVCGVGICANAGTISCAGGVVVQDCTPKPAGVEICNQLDDDCDGTIDDNIAIPGGPRVDAVRSGARTTDITWPTTPGTVFDVLRGKLSLLSSTGGNYAVAVDRCLVDDLAAGEWKDKELPAAGEGYWYLLRAKNCAGQSSYDSFEENGLAGPRDPGIVASGRACP